ncbi:MAG TPA: Xaa-Pro peptidase family protein [Urbifossiella sp.]|nr:Xaa-Pro peptidase family protein [Urbifossiella sp.]
MNYYSLRRQALIRNLKKDPQGPDAALITCPVNVTYLSGFTGEASFIAVTPKASILISDTRFEAQIREECPEAGKGGELELAIRSYNRTTMESTAEVLTKLGVKSVAVESNRISFGELEEIRTLVPRATFVPMADLVETLRTVKDMGEVEKIRDAVRVAERAYLMFIAMLRPADTEKDMVDALDSYMRRAGARCAAFPTIVAAGERGALPHAPPTSRQLEDTSKLLIDWGADLIYKSDMTRTIRSPFVTTPTRRNKFERVGFSLEEVHGVVLAAQNAALAEIRPGAKAKDVDAAARKVIAGTKLRSDPSIKLSDCFTHGLGHGIGLEIHEKPRIRPNSEDVLEAGMVVTVEPGLYLPGWGGVRIEDDVLVTRDGHTLLTSVPRDLSITA